MITKHNGAKKTTGKRHFQSFFFLFLNCLNGAKVSPKGTCSHRSSAGQSQEAFLLQDKTRSDKRAGAHGQRQADVEVQTIHLHLHGVHTTNDGVSEILLGTTLPKTSENETSCFASHDKLAAVKQGGNGAV